VRFERAAAQLDAGGLAEIGSEPAKALVARLEALEDAGAIVAAARQLYLPRPTARELPESPLERAEALEGWSRSLDGGRLGALLSEVRAPQTFVALTALRAGQQLIAGLPAREARVRAERLREALAPRAQAALLLVELSVLDEAAGRAKDALAEARQAAGQGPSVVVASRAAELEARLGEPAVALLAVQALSTQGLALLEAHRGPARASAERPADRLAVRELCAAARVAAQAQRLLAVDRLASEPGIAEARARAAKLAAAVGAEVTDAERGLGDPQWVGCGQLDERASAKARSAALERVEAARRLAGSELAAAALERAHRRDPDAEVQRALGQPPDAAHAEAAPAR
jgi:hypothetical protein